MPSDRNSHPLVRRTALGAGVLALVLMVPSIAWAHPSIRGGQAPVDSLAELTLAMAHGCGTEQSGGGDPTLEVAMEVPGGVRIVDAVAPDGWEVELVGDPIDVVEWRALDALDPAPELQFQAVFSGSVGDEVYLKVFQGCEGFAYRWVGTPDEPASDPAIRVVLAAADPDAPAPPEPVEIEDPASDEQDVAAPESAQQPAEPEAVLREEERLGEEPDVATAEEGTPDLDLVTLALVAVGVAALSGGVWWMQSASRRRR